MNDTTTVRADPEVVSLIETICGDLAAAATTTSVGSLDQRVWTTLAESGLLSLIDVGDPQGLAHAAALSESVARHRLVVPSGEHDLLSRWVAQTINLDTSELGPVITAVLDDTGHAARVPWARHAQAFIAITPTPDGPRACVVGPDQVSVSEGHNHAGDPRDDIAIGATALAKADAIDSSLADVIYIRGAYLRAVQTAGAMAAAVEASLNYASEREQFGRPIARFPLVQRMLVESVNESQLAAAAVDHATAVLAQGSPKADQAMAVAIARSVVGRSAGIVDRHAHQVHGAIGTTAEHPLHRSTQAIEAWCSEFGTTSRWEKHITDRLCGTQVSIWDLIA